MGWPLSQDYNEAIQSPDSSFADPELRTGEAVCNALGIPLPRSGNFADVYEVRCPNGSRWAVKCFTRQVPGLRERYQEISRCLQQAKLPFTVEFTYLEQGIRVHGQWYPVLKMQWVEGLTFNDFVRQHLDRPPMLEGLLQIWGRMGQRLRAAGIAHADLQHGNVLLVPGSTASAVAVKLIDYDGMYVPSLAGRPSGEVGHPCYQHPQRLRDATYSPEVDRLPLLLIAASLRCLRLGGRPLWERYDNGDNLLFREADLRAPAGSELFRELTALADARARLLVDRLRQGLAGPLDQVPLLDEVLPELETASAAIRATPPPAPVRGKAAAEAPIEAVAIEDEEPIEAEEVEETEGRSRGRRHRRSKKRRNRKGAPVGLWVAFIAAVLLVGGGATFLALRNRGSKTSEPGENQQAQVQPKPPADPPRDGAKPPPPNNPPNNPPERPGGQGEPPPPPPMGPVFNPEDGVFRERHVLKADGAVRAAAVSADGRRALSAGPGSSICLWDLEGGGKIRSLNTAHGEVRCLAFGPTGTWFLYGGQDGILYQHDLDTGQESARCVGHKAAVYDLDIAADGRHVLSVAADRDMRYWNLANANPALPYRNTLFDKSAVGLRFCAAGDLAVTWHEGEAGGVLWRIREGGRDEPIVAPGNLQPREGLLSMALAAGGGRFLCGHAAGQITVYSRSAGWRPQPLANAAGAVRAVVLSPDGRLAAAAVEGAGGRALLCYDVDGGKEVQRFDNVAVAAGGLKWSADGRRLVAAGSDGTVRVYDCPGGPPRAAEKPPDHGPKTVVALRELGALTDHVGAVESVACTGDGRVVTGTATGIVYVWSLKERKRLRQFPDPAGGARGRALTGVGVAPDDKVALVAVADNSLRLIDLASGQVRWNLPRAGGSVRAPEVSPDGALGVTGALFDVPRVWDLAKGQEVARFIGHDKNSSAIARFLPDGERVLSAGSDAVLCLWEARTGKELRRFAVPGKAALALAVAPDGARALTGGDDSVVRLWDLNAGKELRHFDGFPHLIEAVAVSPDGRLGVASSLGGKLAQMRVWDLATGLELAKYQGEAYSCTRLTFSADGKSLLGVLGTPTTVVRIWEVSVTPAEANP
jgi:WD40 repeat protein